MNADLREKNGDDNRLHFFILHNSSFILALLPAPDFEILQT